MPTKNNHNKERFLTACLEGDLNVVKEIILNPKFSKDIKWEKSNKMPQALELIIGYKQINILKFLLENDSTKDKVCLTGLNEYGLNVLSLCSLHGFKEGFDYLLSNYDFEKRFNDEEISEILFKLTTEDRLDWIKEFDSHYPIDKIMYHINQSTNQNLLNYALYNNDNNSEIFEYLLEKVSISEKFDVSNLNPNGDPEFFSSIYYDNVELFKLLINSPKIEKFDIYLKNIYDEDILVSAALNDAKDTINYLVFDLNFDFTKGTYESIEQSPSELGFLLDLEKIRENKNSLEKVINVNSVESKKKYKL